MRSVALAAMAVCVLGCTQQATRDETDDEQAQLVTPEPYRGEIPADGSADVSVAVRMI